MLEYFNENGWTCKKMRFDPCLFKVTSPKGNITYLLVHVDDCDIISQLASDSAMRGGDQPSLVSNMRSKFRSRF